MLLCGESMLLTAPCSGEIAQNAFIWFGTTGGRYRS